MKKHKQEADFTGEGTKGGEDGSGWGRLYSMEWGHMFYYNEKSELSYGLPAGLSDKQAEEIATDIIAQESINAALNKVSGPTNIRSNGTYQGYLPIYFVVASFKTCNCSSWSGACNFQQWQLKQWIQKYLSLTLDL